MCDIWFTRYNNSNEGGYRQYMPVAATEDGVADTCSQTYLRFYLIRVPGVPAERVQKYFAPHLAGVPDESGDIPTVARRRWILRAADFPLAARQKFQSQGYVTIKVGDYDGPYDYTWSQVKRFFRDNMTGLDETEDI